VLTVGEQAVRRAHEVDRVRLEPGDDPVLDAQRVARVAVVDRHGAQVVLDQLQDGGACELLLLDVVDRVAADARRVQDLRHRDHDPGHDHEGQQHLDQREARVGPERAAANHSALSPSFAGASPLPLP
jgi:hypothetical protein